LLLSDTALTINDDGILLLSIILKSYKHKKDLHTRITKLN